MYSKDITYCSKCHCNSKTGNNWVGNALKKISKKGLRPAMHEDHVVVVCPKLKNLLCAFHEVSTEVWLKVHTRYEKSPFCGLSTNPSWLKYSDIQISWQTMPPKITRNWHRPGISEDQMDKRETGDSRSAYKQLHASFTVQRIVLFKALGWVGLLGENRGIW